MLIPAVKVFLYRGTAPISLLPKNTTKLLKDAARPFKTLFSHLSKQTNYSLTHLKMLL
jgi:hypothetical protein